MFLVRTKIVDTDIAVDCLYDYNSEGVIIDRVYVADSDVDILPLLNNYHLDQLTWACVKDAQDWRSDETY